MRASDSDNFAGFEGKFGFLVAALPVGAFFADEESVIGTLLHGKRPRFLRTVGPLVDSFESVNNGDLHIVPVVLVVIIAVNNVVTEEALFEKLSRLSSGSGLGSRSFAAVAARSRATSNSVDFAMRSSDSHNSISFIGELGFLVAALPIRAFFADNECVSGAWPQRECPRDLSTVCPLVDSFVSVYDSDLHIVPVVLVVLIAVNDEVTEEAHFMDWLGRSRFGSRLRLNLARRRFAAVATSSTTRVFASAASIMRLPFLGIIARPRELALSAALGLTTVLISQGSAVITPV